MHDESIPSFDLERPVMTDEQDTQRLGLTVWYLSWCRCHQLRYRKSHVTNLKPQYDKSQQHHLGPTADPVERYSNKKFWNSTRDKQVTDPMGRPDCVSIFIKSTVDDADCDTCNFHWP